MFLLLKCPYVRSILEYNSSVWSPYLIIDIAIALIESVQKNFSCVICIRCNILKPTNQLKLLILGLVLVGMSICLYTIPIKMLIRERIFLPK